MRLLFLHGPAAAGKLTIGRAIAARTGIALFHNHLVVDTLLALFPFASPPFVRLREAFWLAAMIEAAAAGTSLIFTFAPEPSVAPDFPERVRSLVTRSGGTVDFVALTLPDAEQEARIDAASRAEFAKLRSLDLLRAIRADERAAVAAMPPSRLTIDTATMSADEAAERIIVALGLPTVA